MTTATKKKTDALAALHRRYIDGKPHMEHLLAQARQQIRVAELVYDLRQQSGLSQQELAERVGTTRSVISRLEDANYSGHSLTMLQRIAAALDHRVELSFVPIKPPRSRRTTKRVSK